MLADPPPSQSSESTNGERVGAVWEDEVTPQEMQFWRRDVKRFIAELTETDPLLSRVVRWLKTGRCPAARGIADDTV